MEQTSAWSKIVTPLLVLGLIVLVGNLFLLWLLVQRLPEFNQRSISAEVCSDLGEHKSIYVPAYSHIYQDGLPVLMEVALSLHNTDPEGSITIERVDYFDSHGKLLRRFLQKPVVLQPLMSLEYLVEKTDFAGGMGANFLIYWSAMRGVAPPLTEALMTGGEQGQWSSFTSRGEQRVPGPAGVACVQP